MTLVYLETHPPPMLFIAGEPHDPHTYYNRVDVSICAHCILFPDYVTLYD